MKKTLIPILLILMLFSCNKEDELAIVSPKEYLPAYPGSYWTYTNGERIMVNTEYITHSYQLGVSSSEMSEEKRVPCYNGKALYEYSIEQYSSVYPLKKLLIEKGAEPWIVDKLNGEYIKRQLIKTEDSIPIVPIGVLDTTWYPNVLVVVEFIDSLTVDRWNYKEYYAKNIGLIKSEINNPFDTLPPIVEKELIYSHINK
ncbi:MAG: hypothetical protein JEZ09_17530 [Salinivirgaceae bacterium]|nr:hypothetical protein [Salinivirgaceae bacterium]